MSELSGQPRQESPVTRADKVADNLARLREAKANSGDQALIAERIEKRKKILRIQIERARQKVDELEKDFQNEVAHRSLVEAVLKEELRLAGLPFTLRMFKGDQVGPQPKQ